MNYKKISVIAFALAFALSLSACKNNESSDDGTSSITITRYDPNNTDNNISYDNSIVDDNSSTDNSSSDSSEAMSSEEESSDDSSELDISTTHTALSLISKINSDNSYFKSTINDMNAIYTIEYCRFNDKAYIYNGVSSSMIYIDGAVVYQCNPTEMIYAKVSDTLGSEMIDDEFFGYEEAEYKYQSGATSLVNGQTVSTETYIVDYYGTDITSVWYFDENNELLKIEDDNLMNNGIKTFSEIIIGNGEDFSDKLSPPSSFTEVDIDTLTQSFVIEE